MNPNRGRGNNGGKWYKTGRMNYKIINISSKKRKGTGKGERKKKERKRSLKRIFFSYLLLNKERNNRI